ncbi:MAG TPA: ATP-binding protein, partial [Flavobacteriales bacterium]|nr:ATP-binding protein [Flavobacteriales bacterium]
ALLDGIEEGALRTKEIVLGLKNFSRVGESDLKEANVHEGINSTLMLLKNRLKSGITVKKQYGDIPVIECLPGKLNQVFMNIIKNAIDAVEGKGTIEIKTWADNDNVYISVCDTGPGMDEETRKKVFEPFFTTKPMGEGTGLGLSISYGIIRQHRGTLEVFSEPGKGAEFLICLPVRGDESALEQKK